MAVIKYKTSTGDWATITNYSVTGLTPVQNTGSSTSEVMSQNAVTQALNGKVDSSTFNENVTKIINTELYGSNDKPAGADAVTTENLNSTLASYAKTADIPTKVSDLDNDSGFTTNVGTVTSVTGGTGLNGGSITNSGTLSVKYGSEAGTACQGNDARLSDARTPVAHVQASNTITAMTNYSKPSSTSAIAATDTLNAAIGKLEKALDGKQASGTYVTSVGLSVPTGLSVASSPITSSGTIAVSMAEGYSIPLTASQTNWSSAYDEATYNTGVNTGASITSVPVNKRTVICSNITTTTQQTFALNGAMTAGRELHIVGKATVDAKIAFTEDSTHVCMTASPLEVATGKYFEINVLFANGVYYIRAIAQD